MGKSKKVDQLKVIAATALLLGAGSAVDKTNADGSTNVVELNAVVQLQEETETTYEMVERLIAEGEITLDTEAGMYVFDEKCDEMLGKIIAFDLEDMPNSIYGVNLAINVKSIPKGGGVVSRINITMEKTKQIQNHIINDTNKFINENSNIEKINYTRKIRNASSVNIKFFSSETANSSTSKFAEEINKAISKLGFVTGIDNKQGGTQPLTIEQAEQYNILGSVVHKENIPELLILVNKYVIDNEKAPSKEAEEVKKIEAEETEYTEYTDIAKDEFSDLYSLTNDELIAVGYCKAKGILNGSDGKFAPNDYLSRESGTTLMLNVIGIQGEKVNKEYDKLINDPLVKQFADVTGWSKEEILVAKNMGLVNGISETEFNPTGLLTDAALMTMSLKEVMKDETNTEDPYHKFNEKSKELREEGYTWVEIATELCREKGIVGEDEMLDNVSLTRVEVAKYMMRVHQIMNPETVINEGEVDSMEL